MMQESDADERRRRTADDSALLMTMYGLWTERLVVQRGRIQGSRGPHMTRVPRNAGGIFATTRGDTSSSSGARTEDAIEWT